MLQTDPGDLLVIRHALAPHHDNQGLTERLWKVVEDGKADFARRLRAACALAEYAPADGRWHTVRGDVATALLQQPSVELGRWTEALRPAGKHLLVPLAALLEDEKRSGPERSAIAGLYPSLAEGQAQAFAPLVARLKEESAADAPLDARNALAKRQANVAAALVAMGQAERVWPLLRHTSDPTRRSFLIDRLAAGGADPKVLLARLDAEPDPSIKRAILLSLGDFDPARLPPAERQAAVARLVQLFHDDPDPGIHGAAEWLLRQWDGDPTRLEDRHRAFERALATGKVEGGRQWYVNRQGQTMVVVRDPPEFWMGSPANEIGRQPDETRHRRQIGHSFAIAAKEVMVAQFLRFRKDHKYHEPTAPTRDCPINQVSWFDAAAYCNWLSKEEGIPEKEWCYEPNAQGQFAAGMKVRPNYLQRRGYRPPTEAEWEYACRAGAETMFACGAAEELFGKYAWYDGNSEGKSHAAGLLRPNDLGLFDMHGNAWEWCQDVYQEYGESVQGKILKQEDDKYLSVSENASRVLRGGSFDYDASDVRCGCRYRFAPANRFLNVGFRPARTFP
jgi:formylglycine-generating enzyme required for sulfatase activity